MTLPGETSQASAQRPVVVVACRVLQDLLERLLPGGEIEQLGFIR